MSDWQSEALAELEHAREFMANEITDLIELVPAGDLFGGVAPGIDEDNDEFEAEWDIDVMPLRQTVTVHVDGYGDIDVVCFAKSIYHDTFEDTCRVTYTAVIKTNSSKEG